MKDRSKPSGCLITALVCLGIWMVLSWLVHLSGLTDGHWELRNVEAVPGWFEENREAVLELRDLLLPHGAIRAVSPRKPPDRHSRYAPFSAADEAAYAEAAEMIRRLRISSVAVLRLNGTFKSMHFRLWRQAGIGNNLIFRPGGPPVQFNVPPGTVRALPDPGWYVEMTELRENASHAELSKGPGPIEPF